MVRERTRVKKRDSQRQTQKDEDIITTDDDREEPIHKMHKIMKRMGRIIKKFDSFAETIDGIMKRRLP